MAGLQMLQVEKDQLAEALDSLSILTKREIDDLRRDNSALKLRISKTLNNLEDTINEGQSVKAKFEKIIMDKESAHEREKKLLEKVLKEAKKEIKALKATFSSPKKPLIEQVVQQQSDTFY